MKPELIGRGCFTKCYRLGRNKVRLVSTDPAKECVALGWGSNSRLFPRIKRIETEVYEMEYFPKVKSLKAALRPDQYELYRALRNINVCPTKGDFAYLDELRKQFNRLPKWAARALNEQIDGLMNYGADIRFEISPRNVAVKNGKLILLDCFFFASKLREVRGIKKNLKNFLDKRRKVW